MLIAFMLIAIVLMFAIFGFVFYEDGKTIDTIVMEAGGVTLMALIFIVVVTFI